MPTWPPRFETIDDQFAWESQLQLELTAPPSEPKAKRIRRDARRLAEAYYSQPATYYYVGDPATDELRSGYANTLGVIPDGSPTLRTAATFPFGASAQEPILAGSRDDPFGWIRPPKTPGPLDRRRGASIPLHLKLLATARSRASKR